MPEAESSALADISSREEIFASENFPAHQAERAVLGALLLGDEGRYDALERLSADDFISPAHSLIYQAIHDGHIRGEHLDALALCNELEQRGELERIGGQEKISDFIADVPDLVDLSAYAQIVRDNAMLRRLGSTVSQIAGLARRPGTLTATEVFGQAEMQLFSLSRVMDQGSDREKTITVALKQAVDRIDRFAGGEPIGLSSGFANLDHYIFGLCPGDMIVLAGRPSSGKTAFALSLARTALKRCGVLMFSLEMSAHAIAERLLIMESGVEGNTLRQGKMNTSQRKDFAKARENLDKLQFWVDDSPDLKTSSLASRARRLKRENSEIGMIIVDYMQLLRGEKAENRTQEVAAISRHLKALARELDIPVLALSQLSRAVEMARNNSQGGSSRPPQLSDLRDSGGIEQDADVVMLLHRKKQGSEENSSVIRSSEIRVEVAKHRNGPTGTADMIFYKPLMRFKADESGRDAGVAVPRDGADAGPV